MAINAKLTILSSIHEGMNLDDVIGETVCFPLENTNFQISNEDRLVVTTPVLECELYDEGFFLFRTAIGHYMLELI